MPRFTNEQRSQHTTFILGTLVPDLRDAGQMSIADDLEKSAHMINEQAAQLETNLWGAPEVQDKILRTLVYTNYNGDKVQWSNQTVAQLLRFWANCDTIDNAPPTDNNRIAKWNARNVKKVIEEALND